MPGELSREEKRAIRKAEKRKAKFGTEVAADAPKGSSESTQQQQQGLLSGGDVDINDAAKIEKRIQKRNNSDGVEDGIDSRNSKRREQSSLLPPAKAQTDSSRTNVQPDSNTQQEELIQDAPRKKRKLKESRGTNQSPPTLETSKKSKKSKNIPVPPPISSPDLPSDASIPESSQKATQSTEKTQTASSRTNVHPESDTQQHEPIQDTPRKKEKQKDKESKSSQTTKKSKKLKETPVIPSVTTFLNPSLDDSIPESSQKALLYAYEFSRRQSQSQLGEQNHEQWKFSKAKQNWLVRHIWYDDAVPEKHVPLVVGYLQSVKGGAREAIIKGCKILLNPTVAAPTQNDNDADSNDNGDVVGRKVQFASAEQVADANDMAPVPASDPAEKRVDIRQRRARLLLDAMEASETS